MSKTLCENCFLLNFTSTDLLQKIFRKMCQQNISLLFHLGIQWFDKIGNLLYRPHHDQLYKHICMQNHNDDTIKTSDTILRKIYISLYLKGLSVSGSWRLNVTATYWPPHSIGHNRDFFLFSWVAQAEARGPAFLGAGFLYRILSPTCLIPKLIKFSVHWVI